MVSATSSAIHGLHEDFRILFPPPSFGVIYFIRAISREVLRGLSSNSQRLLVNHQSRGLFWR